MASNAPPAERQPSKVSLAASGPHVLAVATWTVLAVALLTPLAGCAGASAQPATPDAASSAAKPALWRPPAGSRMVSYGCGHSGIPWGLGDYATGIVVDLDAGLFQWSLRDGVAARSEGPQPVPAPALAEIRRLVDEVLVDPRGWPHDVSNVDSAVCSLIIDVSGALSSLSMVQRKTLTRDDAPDLLIRQITALRSPGRTP